MAGDPTGVLIQSTSTRGRSKGWRVGRRTMANGDRNQESWHLGVTAVKRPAMARPAWLGGAAVLAREFRCTSAGSPSRPLSAFAQTGPLRVHGFGRFAETAPKAYLQEVRVVCWGFAAGLRIATNVMDQGLDADPAPARVGNRVRMPPRDQINLNAAVSECRFRAKPRATATKARQRLAGKWRRVSIRN